MPSAVPTPNCTKKENINAKRCERDALRKAQMLAIEKTFVPRKRVCLWSDDAGIRNDVEVKSENELDEVGWVA
jgi:hypothetical protein